MNGAHGKLAEEYSFTSVFHTPYNTATEDAPKCQLIADNTIGFPNPNARIKLQSLYATPIEQIAHGSMALPCRQSWTLNFQNIADTAHLSFHVACVSYYQLTSNFTGQQSPARRSKADSSHNL